MVVDVVVVIDVAVDRICIDIGVVVGGGVGARCCRCCRCCWCCEC